MGIFLALLASLFASLNNFAQRKSIEVGQNCKGFVLLQLFTSFVLLSIAIPCQGKGISLGKEVLTLGVLGGIFQGLLTYSIAKSLERGPAALTFAFLSSASILPALGFYFLFGPTFGYSYTLWNAMGSILVISGLFWAVQKAKEEKEKRGWGKFMFFAFAMHALVLAYFGLWAFILRGEHPLFSSISIPENDREWFMPIILFTALIMQLIIYFSSEKRTLRKKEVYYGIGGGISHGLCSFLILLAPQKAASWENAMLFPAYAIMIIIICNLWAQFFYKEKIHWKANILAFSGLILGTLGS